LYLTPVPTNWVKNNTQSAPNIKIPAADKREKSPADYAAEFAAAYITAAHPTKALSDLRCIGFDGHKFEVYVLGDGGQGDAEVGQWALCQLDTDEVWREATGTVFIDDDCDEMGRVGTNGSFFRLAVDD
jgi:hypothetical protein